MKTTTSIEIDATPEQVWPWIYDENKILQWVENLVHSESIEQVPGEVGSRFIDTFVENGREMTMEGVVKSYNEFTDYEVHLTGDLFDLTIAYELEDLNGSTRATQTSIVKLKGFFKLMAPLFLLMRGKSCRQQIEMMTKMKTLCEADVVDDTSENTEEIEY